MWKHTSTSREGIRKPKTGDKASKMATPVHWEGDAISQCPTQAPTLDCAGLATYRCDDCGHTNGLLEDQPPFILGRGIDDVSINTTSFL